MPCFARLWSDAEQLTMDTMTMAPNYDLSVLWYFSAFLEVESRNLVCVDSSSDTMNVLLSSNKGQITSILGGGGTPPKKEF